MSLSVQSSLSAPRAPCFIDRIAHCIQREAGKAFAVASTVLALGLDLVAPSRYNMRSHVFTPGRCVGGELLYQGDVPVLSLDADDPFIAGKAQGYLCGRAIHDLGQRMEAAIHILDRQPRASQLPKTIKAFRRVIPREYLCEMEGLVEGYKQWAQEHRIATQLDMTVDDVLLTNLLPERCYFEPSKAEGALAPKGRKRRPVACSVVIEKEPKRGFVFARNMDWPALRMAGSHSLVVHRKHTNGLLDTLEVGLPGIIGTITGMNSQGLSLAMNVCSGETHEVKGMPSTLYNRMCLERFRTVADVRTFALNCGPLGPFHLSAADRHEACSFHFFQSSRGIVIRHWKKGSPLVTLNCHYRPKPCCHMHWGEERQKVIDEFFLHRQGRPLEDVLALSPVNNDLTVHRVVMEPKTRTMRVAFDNALAGTRELQPVRW